MLPSFVDSSLLPLLLHTHLSTTFCSAAPGKRMRHPIALVLSVLWVQALVVPCSSYVWEEAFARHDADDHARPSVRYHAGFQVQFGLNRSVWMHVLCGLNLCAQSDDLSIVPLASSLTPYPHTHKHTNTNCSASDVNLSWSVGTAIEAERSG